MVERAKSEGRTLVWPPQTAVAWRRRAPFLADGFSRFAEGAGGRLWDWALADVGPGRLIPWLAIAFGAGIVLYFTAEHEPTWWAGPALALPCAAIALFGRARPLAFPIALGLAALGAGFATGTLKALLVAHPVVAYAVSNVEISGFIEVRERRERTDRIVIRVEKIEGARLGVKPDRVRLSVRKNTAPAVGSFVTLKTRLNPPLQPLRPGSYDFARDLYFQGIGASGWALGQIKVVEPAKAAGFWTRYAAAINAMREVVDARIRTVIPGDEAAIASALLTGTRDAISAPINDAMYVSSLAHVLSISGYHMAVVAGVVFFIVRAILALVPGWASRYPIKKLAALAALGVAAFYLLLSGAEVATKRSFIMTAIVLIGVMFDRPALTLRTIAVAALAVLLMSPEAVVHPSFQMSFAATLALISGYQHGLPWFSAMPDNSRAARVALWGGREIAGLILASLLAGFATTPYAAYHFHRLAPYGVLANLLAMPIVSAIVMPAGMLAIFAIPFGFDGPLWRLMGLGIDWMVAVALWVAHLPGAVGRMAAFGSGPLLLCSAGLIVLCLLRTPLRWFGAGLIVLASLWAYRTPLPDILVSSDARMVAVRTAAGPLSVMKQSNDDFTIREWLAADADGRAPRDATLAIGTKCDEAGCVGLLRDQRVVALAFAPDALEDDCRRAAVIVTTGERPAGCAALTIERNLTRQAGALALRWNGSLFEIARAHKAGHDRPWMPRPAQSIQDAGQTPTSRPALRDATPRVEDIEPGD